MITSAEERELESLREFVRGRQEEIFERRRAIKKAQATIDKLTRKAQDEDD